MTDTRVWITGASAGLGAALVETLPFPDAHVVDVSRSGGTPGTEHLPADLADPAAWAAVGAHLNAQIGEFTGQRLVLVHNAGLLEPIGFAGEVDAAAYRRLVLLDSAAPQVLGNAFLTAIAAAGFSGRADLVMITSGAARSVYPGWSAYGAGKAAVDQWVRIVGAEQAHRGSGVRVVSVAPGVVDTGMQELVRDTDAVDFPAVGKFRDLAAAGDLVAPVDAARRIWALLEDDPEPGTVTDVRPR